MSSLVVFFLSLAALWLGANLITRSALRLAKSWGMSEGFIGMTVLALGTSFPEITIGFTGALQKLAGQNTSGIVVGNAIGASMNQLILIVAIAGLIKSIKFRKDNVFFDSTFVIATMTAFYVTSRDGLISRSEGMVFILFYLLYLTFLSRQNFLEKLSSKIKQKFSKKKVRLADILWLVLGLMIIAKSSQLVLGNGVLLASQFGVSEATIGILLLGFGASLPELVVSISAALRGATALSLGNLIGGTVVNICVAMGLGAAITGWEVDRGLLQFDIPYLLFSSVVVVLFIASRNKLDRKESLLLLSLYLVYLSLKAMGL